MTPTIENGPLQRPAGNVLFINLDSSNPIIRQQKPQGAIRIATDPVMQRAVQKIHDQGPRMVLELLSVLAEKQMQAIAVEREIKRFALLPPGALRDIGCDQIRHFYPLEVLQ